MGRKAVAFLALEAAPSLSDAAPQVDVRKWIQIMPLGVPPMNDGRKLKVDPVDAAKVLANALGRKSEIPILYEHGWGPRGGEAAGWIHTFEIREDGLWGLVSWTELAATEIRESKWKYLSPGFMGVYDEEDFIHPRALIEASLTNTPAIDGMAPVEAMNEWLSAPLEDESPNEQKEADDMKLSEFAVLLGLPEDADEEKVKARAVELAARPEPKVEPEPASIEMVIETREAFDARVKAEAERMTSERLHALDIEQTLKNAEEVDGTIVPATREAFAAVAKANLDAVKVILANYPKSAPLDRAVSTEGAPAPARTKEEEMALAVKHAKKHSMSISDALAEIRKK